MEMSTQTGVAWVAVTLECLAVQQILMLGRGDRIDRGGEMLDVHINDTQYR